MRIINSQKLRKHPKFLFKAEVMLKCPISKINYFINFPPVFRNFDITNDEATIGPYMHNYMTHNKLPSVDKTERKLTMSVDTMGTYQTFSNYYLWFLLDHGLVIECARGTLPCSGPHTARLRPSCGRPHP